MSTAVSEHDAATRSVDISHTSSDAETAVHRPSTINVRILRQDGPGQPSYWERHQIAYEENMNVISVLQKVAANAQTVDGSHVSPVAWDCGCLEEICGACTMVINGKVRQSCSALVDRLLAEGRHEIELRPMTKFPVVRDLVVDRGRLFQGLKKIKGWIPTDNYYDMGPGPRMSRNTQEQNYPLSECMSCGCCLEACPQYQKVEVHRRPEESDEEFEQRKADTYDKEFLGAAPISQAVLFNSHPTGKALEEERTKILAGPGGIQDCGNSQNCIAVCPKEIPLTTSIGRAGRAATLGWLKKLIGR